MAYDSAIWLTGNGAGTGANATTCGETLASANGNQTRVGITIPGGKVYQAELMNGTIASGQNSAIVVNIQVNTVTAASASGANWVNVASFVTISTSMGRAALEAATAAAAASPQVVYAYVPTATTQGGSVWARIAWSTGTLATSNIQDVQVRLVPVQESPLGGSFRTN